MLWLFVILGLCVFTAALFGFLITVRTRSMRSGLHFIALFLAGSAWVMGHRVSTGWTAILLGLLIEMAAWWQIVLAENAASKAASPDSEATPAPGAPPADRAMPPQPAPLHSLRSIVLLRSRWQATGDVFLASLRRSGQRDARLTRAPEIIRVEIGPLALELQTISAPVPSNQMEYAFAQAFDWPDAPAKLRGHAAHIILTSRAPDDIPRREIVRHHCRAQLALAEFAPIAAILWPDAGRLIQPGDLPALAASDADLLTACVSFRTFPEDGGRVVCDTAGLSAFKLPDIQMTVDGEPDQRTAHLLYKLAADLFAEGCAFSDGAPLPARYATNRVTCFADAAYPPERKVIDLRPPPEPDQPA